MPFDPEHVERARAGEIDLSHCNFEDADLSKLDLRRRRFSGSRLIMTKFIDSDLRGAILDNTQIVSCNLSEANMSESEYYGIQFNSVNMKGVNLRGSVLKGSIFIEIDFSGADFRDTDLTDSQFHGNINLDGVLFNEGTILEGARGLRSLAKNKMFDGYDFNDGVYTKKIRSIDFFSTGEIVINSSESEGVKRIARSIDLNSSQIKVLASSMSALIFERISELSDKKPNEERELKEFEEGIDFLKLLAEGLSRISILLDDMPKEERHDRVGMASKIVNGLSESLQEYIKSDGRKIISIGLVGVASGIFHLCGAPAPYGFLTAAALVGGTDVVSVATKALSGSKGAPEK